MNRISEINGANKLGVGLLLVAAFLHAASARNTLFHSPYQIDVHAIASDRYGLLWLASQQGVFRFDGLHYLPIAGYPFKSARFVAVDPAGLVWAGGSEGLASYQASRWKTILREQVEAMAVSPAGLWLNAGGLRLLSPGGAEQRFYQAKPTGELVAPIDGSLWFPCGQDICTMHPPNWRLEKRPTPVRGDWKKILPGSRSHDLWLSSPSAVALVRGGETIATENVNGLSSLLGAKSSLDPYPSPSGTLWRTRHTFHELPGLGNWDLNPIEEGCTFITSEFTRWFGSEEGVGRSERTGNWQTWAGHQQLDVSADLNGVFLGREGEPLLASGSGVLRFKSGSSVWAKLPASAEDDVVAALGDGYGGFWLATRYKGLFRANQMFAPLERFQKLCEPASAIRALLRDGRGRTWAGGKELNCFFEITGRPGHWEFHPQTLPVETFQAVELRSDPDGRPWVGYQNGIAYLSDSGVWQRIRTTEPVTFVRSFTFDGPNAIFVSRRQQGEFLRLVQSGGVWTVQHFPGDKFGPTDSWYMRRDSRGWIWRGTSDGVQVAHAGRYAPADWLRLTTDNGLASQGNNLQGWAEDSEGNIWLAGNLGVTRVHPSESWFETPHNHLPLVTRVSLNGQTWNDPGSIPAKLPSTRGALEVDVSGMDANQFEMPPLQYRLLPGDNSWRGSSDGRLRFRNLSLGSYTLEAAYTGEGQGQVLRWGFRVIDPVAWWRTWSLIVTMALTLAIVWWRWQWIAYWTIKPLFLMKRAVDPRDSPPLSFDSVAWTNYVGHTFAERYRVLEPIARGGFSHTYAARDLISGEKVVVKVLHRMPGQEAWSRQRYSHEVAAMHSVNHPGVVPLLDSWITANGEPCLAMPFLEGPTLHQLLQADGPLEPARAARLVKQLGSAVAAIHERGIVHRDLKPDNIIVQQAGTEHERAVVIDFGTSAIRGPQNELERTVTLTGSPHYLAPERLANRYSPASDLYSLGVIILEMLICRRPADLEGIPGEAAFQIYLSSRLGDGLAFEISNALHPSPSQRPANAAIWSAKVAAMILERRRSFATGGPST